MNPLNFFSNLVRAFVNALLSMFKSLGALFGVFLGAVTALMWNLIGAISVNSQEMNVAWSYIPDMKDFLRSLARYYWVLDYYFGISVFFTCAGQQLTVFLLMWIWALGISLMKRAFGYVIDLIP